MSRGVDGCGPGDVAAPVRRTVPKRQLLVFRLSSSLGHEPPVVNAASARQKTLCIMESFPLLAQAQQVFCEIAQPPRGERRRAPKKGWA